MKCFFFNRILPLAVAAFLANVAQGAAATGTLDIYWADVEGGAGTLIVTPGGESVLIDTGMPGPRDSKRIYDIANRIAGLKKIDYLIVTHFHMDHFGGAAELAQLIPIGAVYDNGIPDHDPDGRPDDAAWLKSIKPYREFKSDRRAVIRAGDTLPLRQPADRPKLMIRCLAAKQRFAAGVSESKPNTLCSESKSKDADTSDNANSVVMLLGYGPFDLFVGGDLTWNVEAQLVCPVNRVGSVDVYQVDHHGLDLSNNPLLVRSLAPTVAIMSNGTEKGCGPETFSTLKATPSIQALYQIHRNLRKDREHNTADEFIANLEANCQANYIKLSVAPDGKNYTVSIPATGHQRTFQSR